MSLYERPGLGGGWATARRMDDAFRRPTQFCLHLLSTPPAHRGAHKPNGIR